MRRFDFIKYDESSVEAQAAIKAEFELLEVMIETNMSKGRAQALALTKLEEAYMWCGKGIRDDQYALNQAAAPQEARTNG